MSKFKVVKRFKRLSEDLKEYNYADNIELNKKDSEKLLKSKHIATEADFKVIDDAKNEAAKKLKEKDAARKKASEKKLKDSFKQKENKKAPITEKGAIETK